MLSFRFLLLVSDICLQCRTACNRIQTRFQFLQLLIVPDQVRIVYFDILSLLFRHLLYACL